MTGAVLQALASVGRGRGRVAQRAVEWLRRNQNDDGGYGDFKGRDSNAQSTSYAVQGLVAAGSGGDPASFARTYLIRLQRSDGSIAYSSSSSSTPVWVTAQALMALKSKPLPLAAVPRRTPRARASAASDGDGGGASASGGGGGKGGGSKQGAASGGGGVTAGGEPGAGAVGGATADPATTAPQGDSAPGVASAPKSGAAEVKPVPLWAALLALAGVLGLLWGLHRFVLPGR
jgi:hypothetical protein